MHHPLKIAVFLLGLLFLTACASGESSPSSQSTSTRIHASTLAETVAARQTYTQTLTNTPKSTATPTATETPQPTQTLTPTVTSSPTPTEFLGFDQAQVNTAYAYDDYTDYRFYVPNVASSYYGTVEGVPMVCEVDTDYDNILLCRAEEDLFGKEIQHFEFFSDEDHTFMVYSGDFSTPLFEPPPTATPYYTPTPALIWPRADFTSADIYWAETPPGCLERGVNLTCETEYRKYDDGSCLVGQSCWDSCGYYYSVDTIKTKKGDWVSTGPCW